MLSATKQPYTFSMFMSDAGIDFLPLTTRRSDIPMIKCQKPKELKDKIYSKCLSDAKLEIMEELAEQLKKEIDLNKKRFAEKEAELDANNPPAFSKLRNVLGTKKEDVIVVKLKQLKRIGEMRGKRLWYGRKKEMREKILISLEEQKKNLSSDLDRLKKICEEGDEDFRYLNKVEAECDKEIQELESSLEREEKEWTEYVQEIDALKTTMETLESELTCKEEERQRLLSEKESKSLAISERRLEISELERIVCEMETIEKRRLERVQEIENLLPAQTGIQEWKLETCSETELNFTFLDGSLRLNIKFEDDEFSVKDIDLATDLQGTSAPMKTLAISLIKEQFAYRLLSLNRRKR
ncbi:trichohyalin-like [Xenia sp. Carnegie-2017]|uniref:trichohyalin-like n=1 Tax=Xenia sp. Carnegie-2017 TaxID=2897299 RepID=UPI001F04CDBE|nr:trichohyalin-like [Xenia sp. Carnegie-2017]